MDTCRWLVWLLGVFLFPCPLPAQTISLLPPPLYRPQDPPEPPARPSHLPVPGDGLMDLRDPQEALNRRLGPLLETELRDAKAQSLIRKFLKDEKFVRDLRKNLSENDIERLQAKLSQGEGLGGDSALATLLEGLAQKQATLSQEDRDALTRWAEKYRGPNAPDGPVAGWPGGPSHPQGGPPISNPPFATRQSGPVPSDLPASRLPDWSPGWVDRFVRDLDGWVDSPSGHSWRDFLKDMAQRYEGREPLTSGLAERARGLSGYLPRVPRSWWREATARLPSSRLPHLPRPGSLPGAPALPGGSLAGSGKFLVWVAALVLLGVLLWHGRTYVQQLRLAAAQAWKPGPWPVRPEQVATRGDVVRAFEHLALLCLGPQARTCHHLELAQQIGEQPALDADRRRDAADRLARLYEQARYTPEHEQLAQEDIERARRELCYLAGVSAL